MNISKIKIIAIISLGLLFASSFSDNITKNLKLGYNDVGVKKSLKKSSLRILAIGNSFNQDVMAYLPPVLNEMLPDYNITYGILYKSSAGIGKHVDMFSNNEKYTWFNYWKPGQKKWMRYNNAYSLADALALEEWDIITFQGTSRDVISEVGIKNMVASGTQLLQILRTNAKSPFSVMWFQWLGRPQENRTAEEMTNLIVAATNVVMKELEIQDYFPIGIAIQSARTNSTLRALGDAGNMMYKDNIHMQAGLPALINTYVIALKIANKTGIKNADLTKISFIPTDKNCIDIGAREKNKKPGGMTHGISVGINSDNIQVARKVAEMAVQNPTRVTDVSAGLKQPLIKNSRR